METKSRKKLIEYNHFYLIAISIVSVHQWTVNIVSSLSNSNEAAVIVDDKVSGLARFVKNADFINRNDVTSYVWNIISIRFYKSIKNHFQNIRGLLTTLLHLYSLQELGLSCVGSLLVFALLTTISVWDRIGDRNSGCKERWATPIWLKIFRSWESSKSWNFFFNRELHLFFAM